MAGLIPLANPRKRDTIKKAINGCNLKYEIRVTKKTMLISTRNHIPFI
jgi:hypothetical protein